VKAELGAAGRRLALGTGNAFEALGHWLGAADRVPKRHTLAADLVWLGVAGRRLVLLALAGIFYAQLLGRAPYLVYLLPFAWVGTAWHLSDWSATPPPRGVAPSGDVYARETGEVARVVRSPEGVMCTVHLVREEEVHEP
jgi:hypothetical protein